MRLLQRISNEVLRLTSKFEDGDTIPAYAILSHTWGADADEVTYEDLISGVGRDKPGYEKIRFCGEQAWNDGLEYFWIDTCCINKNNKAELSHSIMSMFRWYQKAARCYVYLPDVSVPNAKSNAEFIVPHEEATNFHEESRKLSWMFDFRESRWFTRGWTLQELLAPKSVEFFSKEKWRLGDRSSLGQQIHEITGIPILALQGTALSHFSVQERLSWKMDRKTKLGEDGAYSLLGLFDVHIAPVYGEGAEGAFRRLHDEIHKTQKCIRDIRLRDPRDDKKRIEDTKGGLLHDSYRWIVKNTSFQQWQNDAQSRLLWIKGDPGKGKTMLLCGIINELQKSMDGALVSYFFCQATDARINSATTVLRGLLYMLTSQQPRLLSHVRKRYDDAEDRALFEDANAWVVLTEIFASVLHDPSLPVTYLIIDALDECATDMSKLLDFIAKHSSTASRIKWLVSSRNWPSIEKQLERANNKVRLSLELNADFIADAVSKFVDEKVSRLTHDKKYDEQTRNAVAGYLVSNANDTFLWVALVCQGLEQTSKRHVLRKLETFPPGLSSLYNRMMQQIIGSDDAEVCMRILATTVLAHRPFTLEEISALINDLEDFSDDADMLQEIISLCGSFLTLREGTIYLVHQSAKDFILAEAAEDVFPLGHSNVHQLIFSESVKIMTRDLHRDMYDLKELGYPIENVKQPKPDPLAALRYSCVYWIDHLCDSNLSSSSIDVVDEFLRSCYLYWLEALSLCKSMSKGVASIVQLHSQIRAPDQPSSFTELIYDAYRFIKYHKTTIEITPLQAYASALLFSPTGSLVRRLFQHEKPEWLIMETALSGSWNACLQTLEYHSRPVEAVAFSYDSKLLASASEDYTVKIYDASSGACLQTLEHPNIVTCVAFSRDSFWLATGSCDGLPRIWDVSTGICVKALHGHDEDILSVAFSRFHLASASDDGTIKIWDAIRGVCLRTLQGRDLLITTMAYEENQVASGSNDCTVKIWDDSSGLCVKTLEGHSDSVVSVAFSRNLLASASSDGFIKIWDTSSGSCLHTIDQNKSIRSVTFSHDSNWLASALGDGTISIWETGNWTLLQSTTGHFSSVTSVAFSHDSKLLASGSSDCTVKIWDTSSGNTFTDEAEGYNHDTSALVFSPDSNWLASCSDGGVVEIWDNSGTCLTTICIECRYPISMAFSHDSTHLAVAGSPRDELIQIWDIRSESNGGTCSQTLENVGLVACLAFSPDSTLLANANWDGTIWIRNINSNSQSSPRSLQGRSRDICSIAISYDSTRLVCASLNWSIELWDLDRNVCLQTIDVEETIKNMLFDPTGLYLYTDIGTLSISTMRFTTCIAESGKPQFAELSHDGQWIIYGGKRVLWVPAEYRSYKSRRSLGGRKLAIGMASGKVWICNLDLETSETKM